MAETVKTSMQKKPVFSKNDISTITKGRPLTKREMDLRNKALDCYLSYPVPDRVSHLWRYSDPFWFFPQSIPSKKAKSQILSLSVLSSGKLEKKGVEIVPIEKSMRGMFLFGKTVSFEHGIFEALNAAIWTEGIFIRIPQNTNIEEPIQVICRASENTPATRIIIELEPGASANVVEILEGGGDGSRAISVSELIIGQNATLKHALIQQWHEGTNGHVTVRASVGKDAVFHQTSLALGGSNCKCDLGADLMNIGAESEIVGVAFAEKRQNMAFHTVHRHIAKNTRSKISFKTALAQKAQSAYTGLIYIGSDASQSEAFQESRSLMLSDKARAYAVPDLEILTNDVQCSHAAAVAPLNEKELFYLMSRGISRTDAEAMLTSGFFSDALSKMPISVRDRIFPILEQRLSFAKNRDKQ